MSKFDIQASNGTGAEVITCEAAVHRAIWWIKLPSMLVMFGPPAIAIGLGRLGIIPDGSFWAAPVYLASFAAGFVGGWLVWSIRVPHWRLWAYQRVPNIAELKRLAIEKQIIWPDGSVFERTEIAPAD